MYITSDTKVAAKCIFKVRIIIFIMYVTTSAGNGRKWHNILIKRRDDSFLLLLEVYLMYLRMKFRLRNKFRRKEKETITARTCEILKPNSNCHIYIHHRFELRDYSKKYFF